MADRSDQPPKGDHTSAPQADRQAAASSSKQKRKSGVVNGVRYMWPFELHERLGEGGMGVVYRARYVPGDRNVAVKMLPSDVTDPVVLARFERELEVLRNLKHPNIVRCFGGSTENDDKFYAMEMVTGGTLEDLLGERGTLPWERVVELGRQMAAGLQAAHAQGVVHRDVKPGNFLITETGSLKLSDFGLAMVEAQRRITRAGKTAGTVLYMSPEQIRGQDVGASSDLYALGCVLYEMLSGSPPFDGETQASILHAHVTSPPQRLATKVTDCPAVLEQLIHRMLEKEPADRPASAAEVGAALEEVTPAMRIGNAGRDVTRVTASNIPLEGRTRTNPLSSSGETLERPSLPIPKVVTPDGPAWVAPAAILLLLLLTGLSWSLASSKWRLEPWRDRWFADARGESGAGPQVAALAVLGELGANDAEVEATLLQAMDSPEPTARVAAVQAAAKLGLRDVSIVGKLRRMSRDDGDGGVRSAASAAAQSLKPGGEK